MIEIVPLLDRAEFIADVAQWSWDEWGDMLPRPTRGEFEDYLRTEMGHDTIPIAYLALADGVPAGTVSLILDELETRAELAPWLASLFVAPAFRGRGLGRELVAHAVAVARSLGVGTLHLCTPAQEMFYIKLGWERVEETQLHGRRVTIMRLDISTPATAC